MPIQEYSWWGFDENSPPENLKTRKQLSELGLRTGEPVGVIRTPKYDCYLYDPNTCPAKRPLTEKQRNALMRKKLLKEQAEWERKKQEAWKDLELYLKWIPLYIHDILEEAALLNTPLFSNLYIKHKCDRIASNCRHAREELKFLYPNPVPLDPDGQCRAAVLGGSDNTPLDPDGLCRAAVLGSNNTH